MSLLSSLLRIWKGEILHEEKEKSQQALIEAREAIRETRAMLDGEECWLLPLGKTSNDNQSPQ